MHWGNHSLLVARQRQVPDLNRLQQYCLKVWHLLNHHEIQMVDPKYQIIGVLKDNKNERPQFAFAERLGPDRWVIRDAIDVNKTPGPPA